jgi:hypothetical protein
MRQSPRLAEPGSGSVTLVRVSSAIRASFNCFTPQYTKKGIINGRANIFASHLRRAMAPRKKPVAIGKVAKVAKVFTPTIPTPEAPQSAALPPSRGHHASYHYPLLLDDKPSCDALLSWFKGVEETRSMPWRKTWIDPKDFEGRDEELGQVLGKRAYEVWVSEISK